MWRCTRCETQNDDQNMHCIICGSLRTEQEKLRSDREAPLRKETDQSDSISIGNEKEQYDEWSDDNCVDPYGEYDDAESKEDTPVRRSAFIFTAVGVIAACVMICIVFFLGECIRQKWNNEQNVTSAPTYTPKPTATATRKPTAVPTEEPLPTSAQTEFGKMMFYVDGHQHRGSTLNADSQDTFQARWTIEGAAYYDVSFQNPDGKTLWKMCGYTGAEMEIDISQLPSGWYTFFITPYDWLGQAGETQEQEITVRSKRIELFGYLGSNREAVSEGVGGKKWRLSENGDEYTFDGDNIGRGIVRFVTPADQDCVTSIELIPLSSYCNYCICTIYYCKEVKEMRETLLNAGWRAISQTEKSDLYEDAEGNRLEIMHRNDCVAGIIAYLSESILAEKYTESDVQHTSSQAMGTLRTTGDVNIRKGPGKEYQIVGTIKADSTASYQGQSRKDERGVVWYSVEWDGKNGWVSSKYAELG